ncbi:drug efflux system protein MdtG [compost metagenome]
MGIYALTHLPGNLIAGQGVDKHGSKGYMIFSLISAGIILLLQAHVTAPWQLLVLRSISGFVLAFLSPACLALLASLSKDPVGQGKLMAGHGVVHTLASVVSPAAGAFLVAQSGYSLTFQSLGWLLIVTGIIAIFMIRESRPEAVIAARADLLKQHTPAKFQIIPLRYYLLPLAVSCSQGVLFFELPLQMGGTEGIMHTGINFSIISLGALVTLSMMFLSHFSPYKRTHLGILGLALAFFSLAAFNNIVPLPVSLFALGIAKGVVYPAMASLFIDLSGGVRLGTVFSLQSIAMSLGSFIGPIVAGAIHGTYSPYFMAFLLLMSVIVVVPPGRKKGFGLSPVSTPTNIH